MQEILKLRLWTKRVERRFNVLIHEGTATFSEGFVHPCESRVLLSKAQVYPCDVKRGYLAYRRSRYEQLVENVPSWLLHAREAISMSQSCRPERCASASKAIDLAELRNGISERQFLLVHHGEVEMGLHKIRVYGQCPSVTLDGVIVPSLEMAESSLSG
jgi:hypothetical protein